MKIAALWIVGSLSLLLVLGSQKAPATVYVDLPEPHFREPISIWSPKAAKKDELQGQLEADTAVPTGPVLAIVADGVSRTTAAFGNHLIKIYDTTNNGRPIDHIWLRGYGSSIFGLSVAVSEPTPQTSTAAASGTLSNDYNIMGYLAKHCPDHDQSSLIYSGGLYKMTRRPSVFPIYKPYDNKYYKESLQPLSLPLCRLPLLVRSFGVRNRPKLLCSKDGARFYFLDTSDNVLYIALSQVTTRNMASSLDEDGPECATIRISLKEMAVVDLALDRERDIVFVSRVDQNILAIDGKTGMKLTSFSVNNRRPFSIEWDGSIRSLIVCFRFEDARYRAPLHGDEEGMVTAGQFNDIIARVDLSGPVSEWRLASTRLDWIVFPRLDLIKDTQVPQEDGKLHVLLKSTQEKYNYDTDANDHLLSKIVNTYWQTYQWTGAGSAARHHYNETDSHDKTTVKTGSLSDGIYHAVSAYQQLSSVTLEPNYEYMPAMQSVLVSREKGQTADDNSKRHLYRCEQTKAGTILARLDLANQTQEQEESAPLAANLSSEEQEPTDTAENPASASLAYNVVDSAHISRIELPIDLSAHTEAAAEQKPSTMHEPEVPRDSKLSVKHLSNDDSGNENADSDSSPSPNAAPLFL